MAELKTIEIKKGDRYLLTLKGLGTAGYLWTYTIEDNTNAITITKEMSKNDDLEIAKDDTAPITFSKDEIFEIHGINFGDATIHFVQCRQWEKNKLPLNRHDIKIVVKN